MNEEKQDSIIETNSKHNDFFETYNEEYPEPTEEDWKSLPEVSDAIPKTAFLVILIEFCERFTYYGLSGPFQNYIQNPPPPSYPASLPGAMGKGQQTATALNTFFTFWCYITPILGAVIADQFWGKYRTILVFSIIYLLGLTILTLTSIPPAIASGASFPGYIVAIIIVGLGTGGIKSNVSPLVAEQYRSKSAYVKTLKNGKRVIVTPQATYQKIFNFFYWGINIGSLSAIATTELEKNVGFWPAFVLPTLMFIPCIIVVILGRNQYIQNPPRGSVFIEAGRLFWLSWKVKGGIDACKPSNLAREYPEYAIKATWDDVFVDELKRTLKACVIFCWFPIYWLCYSQMTNNLVSMAGTMLTGNVPNDIMQNIDPIALIIIIPIMDSVVYPGLRRLGLPMRPIARITCGFFFAAAAMGYTAGIQSMVYKSAPYYDHPEGRQNWISAAYLIPSYVLIAISEIFASITGMEYAYKKAPQSMKSIVMALFLLTNCFASILAFALVSVAVDPKLEWMYTGISAAMFFCTIMFYICHHKADDTDVEEDAIVRDNMAQKATSDEIVAEYELERNR
ncbi:PTR2-domain-containing protein [Rhizopus microsporus var. microsporus]|uniref:MFS peptide transporter n=2 Tax=Rhizopus microsporus TaxID=58291 RepID=A0A2G4SFJ5_RHIZD|nr:MFS peptide transporter [Rhizopus microsporus ATCC 52813]ORE05019.1 PTR2-domain-containing protein [Rhizopus microsporus var. microsporus]PHZ07543.1 MFS peptide transporter [Rhizopus microsporus ATCC 52813]